MFGGPVKNKKAARLPFLVFAALFLLVSLAFSRTETRVERPIVLKGTVCTPDKYYKVGAVLVEGGKITAVGPNMAVPADAIVIQTNGIIFPGFIDSHNHVQYNIFNLWKPTYDTYPNRYTWAKDPRYKEMSKVYNYMGDKIGLGLLVEMVKYGEIKEIMGGATSIQGVKGNSKGYAVLARNVENKSNCLHDAAGKPFDYVGQHGLGLSGLIGRVDKQGVAGEQKLLAGIEQGRTKAFIIHMAEGIDEESRKEFDLLVQGNLNIPEMCCIHCTGLGYDEFRQMGESDAKIIWSPHSNLMLYNRTTDILSALKAGVKKSQISLAPDWTPSGSVNILFEAKVCAEYNYKKLGGVFTAKDILRMITINPARALALDEYIGSLEPGKYADITVLRGNRLQPYNALIQAQIQDVALVMVGGQPIYGDVAYFEKFEKGDDYEELKVNGVPKAIDITEDAQGVPKADQTFEELLKVLNAGLQEAVEFCQNPMANYPKGIKKRDLSRGDDYVSQKYSFKYPQESIKYFSKLAPLYWPRYVSYETYMYNAVNGTGSKFGGGRGGDDEGGDDSGGAME